MEMMFNLEEIKNLIKTLEPKIDRIINLLVQRNKIDMKRNEIMIEMLNELESSDEGDDSVE